ncbi:unnamed protein product [marine sediment metagenome]|uniref:Uncharacterized protein n=1 Tax=marine sediment metagenome TaxID=412755 RepID=X0TPB9_9ZZZZ
MQSIAVKISRRPIELAATLDVALDIAGTSPAANAGHHRFLVVIANPNISNEGIPP